jgi:HK97 family phage major capsid protein/HK97 family phage prohead protease
MENLIKKIQTASLTRELETSKETINVEQRTVEVTFSTQETQVERFFGYERLMHESGTVELSRLNDSAALLFNHNPDSVIGVIERAWVDIISHKGKATVRFSKNEQAEQVFRDVQDGIITKLSVGYRVHDAIQTGERDGLPEINVTRWEPLEISFVSIPADPLAKVGRGEAGETNELRIIGKVAESVPTQEAVNEIPIITRGIQMEDIKIQVNEARETEVKRLREIQSIADAYADKSPEVRKVSSKAQAEGWTPEQFGKEILSLVASPKPLEQERKAPELPKEAKGYSIAKVIRSLVDGTKLDGIEGEIHSSMLKDNSHINYRGGILLPTAVLNRTTMLTSGNSANAIGTQHMGSEFVDAIYEASILPKLGVQVRGGFKGNASIPTLSTTTTAAWVSSENVAVSESAAVIGLINITPKTVSAWQPISRKTLIHGDPALDVIVTQDLARQIANALSTAYIKGTGATGQPSGLLDVLGDNSIAATTMTSADYSKCLDILEALYTANAMTDGVKVVTTPAVMSILAAKSKDTGSGNFCWDLERSTFLGRPGIVTNFCTAAHLFAGDFGANSFVADFGALELTVEQGTKATGEKVLCAFADYDLVFRVPSAFAYSTSVT